MTHNTREVDEILQDFESRYSYLYQGTVYENGGSNFSAVHESVKHWLRTTLHQQLQKARQDWLRSKIEKLEGMINTSEADGHAHDPARAYEEGWNDALTSIITRHKEELKELEKVSPTKTDQQTEV